MNFEINCFFNGSLDLFVVNYIAFLSSCRLDDDEAGLTALSETVRESYRRFQHENMTLKAIADARQFAITTVEGHLATAFEMGYPVDTAR